MKSKPDLLEKLKFLKFSLSNTSDPINVIHLEGQIKTIEGEIKKMTKTNKKEEPKEQTMADSSGSFEAAMNTPILKRDIYKIHNSKKYNKEGEFKEATDASSSGAFDVPLFGGTKGRKNPLSIGGPKSIAQCRAVKDKNFPKFGGPGGVYIKIKEKCKKFPYCNQGDINAIEPLREAIDQISKKHSISTIEIENIILNEIKRIFIEYEN